MATNVANDTVRTTRSTETQLGQIRAWLCHYEIASCRTCYEKLVDVLARRAPNAQAAASIAFDSALKLTVFDDPPWTKDRVYHDNFLASPLDSTDHYTDYTSLKYRKAKVDDWYAFWRTPLVLPSTPYDPETIRAWNEAKALFGISAEEEP